MDSQARRRKRREAKQAAWKAANPLLVGITAGPVASPPLILTRKPSDRVANSLEVVNAYGLQILQNAEHYAALRRSINEKQRRIYQALPRRSAGPDATGKQTRRGKSIPLI
ncbi:antitermination protein N [Dryocola clanedunensis]